MRYNEREHPSKTQVIPVRFHDYKFLLFFFGCGFQLSFYQLMAQPIDFDHANLSFYRDKDGQKQRIKSKADWNLRRKQILTGMQQAMGNFPAKRVEKFSVTEISHSSLDGIDIKTLRLSVNTRSHVVADVYLPKSITERGKKIPAILALHPTGAPGKRIIGGPNARKNRQYANELAKRGYVVIAPDYPSFGDLKNHRFDKDGFDSGTLQGIVNHMRCVDYLQTLDFVDPEKIGVIGHSLGGHNAIFVAVLDERLKAIVTSCGWTPFHDYYQGKIAGWTSDRYMPLLKSRFKLDPNQVPFDFYELVAALAPRPFFTNSPLHDSNFEVTGIKKAIPKIKQIYSLFASTNLVHEVYPKCQHDFPSEIRAESYRFLDKALGHTSREEIGFGGELPRIDPLEPGEAIKSFNSVEITLAAHEPVVHDPIAMSFDEHRRLFVVEMKDYSEQDQEFLGRIRLLVDQDQDGIYEKSTLYADQLSWPTAVICYDGGVFVGAAPDIWFFKDTDQDGKADIRKKVFSGFGRGNVQGLMNSLRWGLDNRIHGVASSSGGSVFRVGSALKTNTNLRGKDFSFDPRTLDLRAETGGAQHGMCFDDTGTKFVCSNSDHAQVVLYDDRYLRRNPFHRGIRARQSIAVDGGQAPVFRTSPVEPWRLVRTRLRVAGRVSGPIEGGGTAAGYFTGSTGITIYRGDAGAVDKGIAIIGDVGSNIVHQKKINQSGLDITATRIDKNSELVTSTDNWFRPVQFGNSPDGCLYILDMYREVIEHPKSLPPMIKKHLDLTFGRDRGRIYRLGKPKLNRNQEIHPDNMSSEALVQFLDHPNSWHRETAARLIYQKQDASCVPMLQELIRGKSGPLGRLHALHALSGLQKLTLEDLRVASKDTDRHVRRHAILLAEKSDPEWLLQSPIRNLENDPSPRVRMQMAFSIGETSPAKRKPIIWRLMQNSAGHPLMVTAIMSSANGIQSELLAELANTKSFQNTVTGQLFVKNLVDQISKRNTQSDFDHLTRTLLDLIDQEKNETAMQLTLGICSANTRLKQKLLDASKLKPFFDRELKSALVVARDTAEKETNRTDAIRLLSLADTENVRASLLSLVNIEQPVAVQLAALETLGSMAKIEIALTLIQKRNRVGKDTAKKITELLLSRLEWTRLFLRQAKANDLSPGQLQVLEKSSNPEVQKQARRIVSESASVDLEGLVKSYAKSLTQLGDPQNGQKVFEKNCSKCHQAGGIGFEIGPNLSTMKSRGKAAILSNVLNPNREVNPSFLNYIVQTRDGRTITGMIDSESSNSITLKQEKNKLVNVDRTDIEAIKNSGLSLMPTGLEKEITIDQMTDLIEFLMNAK